MAAGWSVMDALNKNSKAAAEEKPKARFRTRDISIRKIYSNDRNFYSMPGIEQLAQEILAVGLMENMTVAYAPCERGEYKIIAGERRWRALNLLLEKGYEDFETVTCQIKSAAEENEEMVQLIIANAYRDKTIVDMLEEEKRLKKYSALQIAAAFGIKPNQINDYTKSSYSNSEMQQLSFLTDTMLFVLKQYEEEVNYKLLTDEEAFSEGKYYKLNEKVLLRTDSKTQMEIFATGVQNGIQKVNECRRKLDLMDAEGGDQLIVNGNYIPITEVGKQYEKAGNAQQQSVLPIQPETDQKTQKDPEEGDRADTTGTEPDEKESQEGGENDEE